MFKQNTDIIFKRHFYRQLAHIVIYFQLNVQLWFLSSAPPFSHFAPSHTTVTSSTFPSLPHARLPSWLRNEVSQGQKCCRSWGWRITIFCLPLCSTRVSCCPPLRTLSHVLSCSPAWTSWGYGEAPKEEWWMRARPLVVRTGVLVQKDKAEKHPQKGLSALNNDALRHCNQDIPAHSTNISSQLCWVGKEQQSQAPLRWKRTPTYYIEPGEERAKDREKI